MRQLNFTGISESAEVTDFAQITISLGDQISNNKMNVIVKNPPIDVLSDGTIQHKWVNNDLSCKFKAIKPQRGEVINEELLTLYANHEMTDPTLDIVSSDYLMFDGVIVKGKIKAQEQEKTIELECKDRNVIVLDRLVAPGAFSESDGWKSPTTIKELIKSAAENVGSMKVLAYDSTGTPSEFGPWLVDVRLFSEGVVASGTTTSASTRKLIDSGGGLLLTVHKDDWVYNTTDETYAYVESVDSDTQLTLSKDIMGSGDTYQVSDGFVQDVRPDGTAFPDISFAQSDKPVIEGIESLSSIDYTNTGTEIDNNTLVCKRGARWFIDKKNRLHWYIPSDTPELIIRYGTTTAVSPDTNYHKVISFDLTNEVDDNINFIVFRAGYDMNGEVIRDYERAKFSGQPTTKESRRDWMHITRNMKDEDLKAGNITKNSYDDYNYPSSYPMTPNWSSAGTSVANDSEYNSALVVEASKRGKAKAQAIFRGQSNPRWKGTINVRGEYVRIGDLISFTSKPHGLNNILVRVTGVSHTMTSSSWTTSISVEEDENEAGV